MGNRNLNDEESSTNYDSAPQCLNRDVPDLEGSWIDGDDSVFVYAQGSPRASPGDFFVTENNQVRNSGNPFIKGRLASKCSIVDDTNQYYCVSTIELAYGWVLYHGPLDGMVMSGGSDCFADVSGKVSGKLYDDYASYDMMAADPGDGHYCIPDGDFTEPWSQTTQFTSINYGSRGTSNPGDKLVVNGDLTTASGAEGRVTGECTFLPETNRNDHFCTLTFALPGGSINVVGQFDSMVITGTTGCYKDLNGFIAGVAGRDGAVYKITIEQTATQCPVMTRFTSELLESGSDVYFDPDHDGTLSAGDSFLFNSHPIETVGSGLANGIAVGMCTIVGKSNHSFCTIVFKFEEGTVATAGFFEDMMILGGTGCYAGIKGMFYGSDLSTELFSYNVVQFLIA